MPQRVCKREALLAALLAYFACSCARDAFAQAAANHTDVSYYVDADGGHRPLQSAADWSLRRADILRGMEAAMGELPSRENLPPFDVQVVADVPGDGYIRRTLTFVTEPGDRLPVDLFLPNPLPAGERRAAIIALHPTGSEGKRIVDGANPNVYRAYGRELAKRGYVVLAPDYPSFGDYPYDFSADAYASGTMKGIFNHMRCVDYLQSLPEVDGERIGVIGHSLGGHNAIFLGAFDVRVKAIVSSCGWTPFHDYYEGNIAGWTSDRYMPRLRDDFGLDPDRVPFDFYEVIAALAPRAFYSCSPTGDDNFAVAGVQKAIPKAQVIYDLLGAGENLQASYPPCGHDFPTESRAAAYEFLDRHLHHQPAASIDFSAELPRIPPRDPKAALAAFHVQPGFTLTQVACEPVVTDPIAMSFDEFGRLFVVEMRDYSEQETEHLGRVRVLLDEDRDGLYERSEVYADGLSWPTAIICAQGGVYVGAAPDLWFLRDNDGDHRADETRKVFTGFGRDNVQGLLNSLTWGLDNRIHGATSSSGGSVTCLDHPERPAVELRGRDFAFDPQTLVLTAESGGGQHGMTFDDLGRKYVCSNSDHLQQVMYEERYVARNPYFAAPGPRVMIAADGPQADVYRTSPVEPWRIVRTRLRVSGVVQGIVEGGGRAAGYFTGATGVTIWRNPELPLTAIVGDVGGNLIHRKRLVGDGLILRGERIDEQSELVTSEDIWFRPVAFANGPGGSLYIADMYREVIEHPKSLPPEIKQHLDLTSGRDRGRIYRLDPAAAGFRVSAPLGDLNPTELAARVDGPHGWDCDTAARLLVERRETSAAGLLRQIGTDGSSAESRVRALHLLDALGQLNDETLLRALDSQLPPVRAAAIRLCESRESRTGAGMPPPIHRISEALSDRLLTMASDPSPQVRYQLAFTLGELSGPRRHAAIATLIRTDGHDAWMRVALRSSQATGCGAVLELLLADDTFLADGANAGWWITELAGQIGRQQQAEDVAALLRMLHTLPQAGENSAEIQRTIVTALQLPTGSELEEQVAAVTGGGSREWLTQQLTLARATAFDQSADAAARVRSINQLGLAPLDFENDPLAHLLSPTQPVDVQRAAVGLLSASTDARGTAILLDQWSSLTPALRREVEEVLLSRAGSAQALLRAVLAGDIPGSDIQPRRLARLAEHTSQAVRELAAAVLEKVGVSPRGEVVDRYRSVLAESGDATRGLEVFRKQCAGCHKLGDTGHPIGPNLTAAIGRGREFVLTNLFDPNREVNPDYLSYTALLQDGRIVSGMIAAETATTITLRQAEGKEETLLRIDIESLQNSGASLMPEGLEKQLAEQDVADLLGFLESSAATSR